VTLNKLNTQKDQARCNVAVDIADSAGRAAQLIKMFSYCKAVLLQSKVILGPFSFSGLRIIFMERSKCNHSVADGWVFVRCLDNDMVPELVFVDAGDLATGPLEIIIERSVLFERCKNAGKRFGN